MVVADTAPAEITASVAVEAPTAAAWVADLAAGLWVTPSSREMVSVRLLPPMLPAVSLPNIDEHGVPGLRLGFGFGESLGHTC